MAKDKRTKLKRLAIMMAKQIARERENHTCQRCGATGCKIDGAHIYSERRNVVLAAHPRNVMALCVKCHMWWHENPMDSQPWFVGSYPEWHKELEPLLASAELEAAGFAKNRPPASWWESRLASLHQWLSGYQARCPHGKPPDECEPCMVESDFQFDAARERGKL